jgi:hypothetical protein
MPVMGFCAPRRLGTKKDLIFFHSSESFEFQIDGCFCQAWCDKRAFVLASLPVMMLAVCPVLASPFESAKSSVLLVFGASACWIVRETLKERTDLHTSGDSVQRFDSDAEAESGASG